MGLCTETESKVKLNWLMEIPATQTREIGHHLRLETRDVEVEDPGQILKWKVLPKGSAEPTLKLDFCKEYTARPGKKPKNLTEVWSENLLRDGREGCVWI